MSRAERHQRDTGILGPFRALLGAQTIASVLGLAFWVLVARVVPSTEVGIASALISSQTLIGLLTNLGMGTWLIAELPGRTPRRQSQLIVRALAISGIAAVLISSGFIAIHPLLAGALSVGLQSPAHALVFVAGGVGAVWQLIIDDSVLGLRLSRVQVLRNVFASVLRFPVVAVFLVVGVHDALVLQICWVAPLLVSILLAWRRTSLPRPGGETRLAQDVAVHGRLVLSNYVLTLALAAGTQLLPVVAGAVLMPADNAVFAVAWLLATFAFLPPYLLATALFAHSANASSEEFRASMRRTLPGALGLSGAIWLGAWLLGGPVLGLFGGTYAEEADHLLLLLVPAGLWMVLKDHLVAYGRSQRRHALAARLASVGLVLEVAGAAWGGHVDGATGLAVGWLVAMGIELVLTLPLLWLVWRGPSAPRLVSARGVRDDRGQTKWPLIAGIVVLVAALGVGVFARSYDSTESGIRTKGAPATCNPSAEPGPRIDLGVQASTGRAARPFRSMVAIDGLVEKAASAGADVISTSVSWATAQPTAGQRYDFRGVDRVIAAAGSRGLQVRVQVIQTPEWARDQSIGSDPWQPPRTARELDRWSRFIRDLVRHLDGGAAYLEIWGEPNAQDTWPTGPDPQQFARLLRVSDGAAHRADPDLSVVSGGLLGNDLGFLSDLLASLGTGAPPFQMIGLHPFNEGRPPLEDDPSLRFAGTFGEYDGTFLGYRRIEEILDRRGLSDIGIYVSEFGFSTEVQGSNLAVPDAERARYLRQTLDAVACDPRVAVFSWYYLHPTPWDPAAWTLLDASGRGNRTYRALQAWSEEHPSDPASDGQSADE